MFKNKIPFCIDLGMHIGDETAYYLARGYNVVAVEANPTLCDTATEIFKEFIDNGRLYIFNRALSSNPSMILDFYVSEENSEWSSLQQWRVEMSGKSKRISVPSITLASIIDEFGMPHYIKCDIEGADEDFVDQLAAMADRGRPAFVSVEGIAIEWLHKLAAAGYDCAQLVNQARFRRGFEPAISFETIDGEEKTWNFPNHSSPFYSSGVARSVGGSGIRH